MNKTIRGSALALMFAALPFSAALADRAPSESERADIAHALSAQGFSSWGKIELDDGLWEVDDAISQDGRKYDLKLDSNLVIIERDLED